MTGRESERTQGQYDKIYLNLNIVLNNKNTVKKEEKICQPSDKKSVDNICGEP